jgi:adenylate cyclase class 2
MQSLETEVKICVRDRAALEQQLLACDFRLVTPSTLERNTLYDTADRNLRAQHQILRVRQYGDHWIVTHKRMPDSSLSQEQHKHRIETETEVGDGEAIAAIFTMLGLQPAFVYEKWRTEYADATGHCVIDDTPIGLFAEFEGPEEWIDAMLLKFNVPAADVMTLSYGRLFERWKNNTGSAAMNLTFAEVAGAAPIAVN